MNVLNILKVKGRAVVTLSATDRLSEVVRKLARHKIGSLVVVDPDGKVVGIVSERDVVRVIAEAGNKALEMPVESVMTSPVRTARENQSIDDLMAQMTEFRIRHLPVVEQGRLVGMVSIGDVVKYRIEEIEFEAAAMRRYISA